MSIIIHNTGTMDWAFSAGNKTLGISSGDSADLEIEFGVVDIVFHQQLRTDLLNPELGLSVETPYGPATGEDAVDYIFSLIYGGLARILAVKLKVFVVPVSSPPTNAELNAVFSQYPIEAGFISYLQPIGQAAMYQVIYDGTKWWVFPAQETE